ncbi:MAG: OB-fold nucleic acid binding domain-containing protein, partial [Sphaerochaetaceae bacterium]
MEYKQRTVTCGELQISDVGRKVVLNGWVHRNRNHGGIHFINLRDRYGITQIVISDTASEEVQNTA